MGPLLAAALPVLGDVASGLLGFAGQSSANAANAAMSREQMKFQERMSNTQWQRGIADMTKAGINPGLAYSQGGASSPSGSMATSQNTMGPASAAASSMVSDFLDAKQKAANIRLTQAEQLKKEAEIPYYRANAKYQSQDWLNRTNKGEADAGVARNEYSASQATLPDRIKSMIASYTADQWSARGKKAGAYLTESQIPEARARAGFWNSGVGQTKPYAEYGADVSEAVVNLLNPLRALRSSAKPTAKAMDRMRPSEKTDALWNDAQNIDPN